MARREYYVPEETHHRQEQGREPVGVEVWPGDQVVALSVAQVRQERRDPLLTRALVGLALVGLLGRLHVHIRVGAGLERAVWVPSTFGPSHDRERESLSPGTSRGRDRMSAGAPRPGVPP